MKVLLKSLICLFLLNSVYTVQAQKTLFEFHNIEATLPVGWHPKYVNGIYAWYSPDETSAILISRDDNTSLTSYNKMMPNGVILCV